MSARRLPMNRSANPPVESVSGLIERVTFFNEETGFAVLKVKVKGVRDLVSVVGSLPQVSAGEWLTAEGTWEQDREHGRQLRATLLRSSAPTTREGIEKYLGSGMVKGIGPVYAKKLIAKFGENIFEIIDHSSARLEEVEGIGPGRRRKIKEAWAEQKTIRDIMVFLHSQGVSTSRAVRIYKMYGEEAIAKVRANPYILARDIQGVGFHSADQIALKMGIPADSLLRASAGLDYVLEQAMSEGHCALPQEILAAQATELLDVAETIVQAALNRSLEQKDLELENIAGQSYIFLPGMRRAEQDIARRIRQLSDGPPAYPPIDLPKAIAWSQKATGKTLAPSQVRALEQALTRRAIIITGGPGVGKTTLLNAFLKILHAKKVQCLLCAPTGRAAKRLQEATGLEAKTIHRLLEVQPNTRGFARNARNPLDCRLLVVDECSMVDVPLMAHLLNALPAKASLVLVGDVDQLPSVGPGAVLAHLIESGRIPVVRLTEVFRQAAGSRIITNAHRINEGLMPELPAKDAPSDFYFIERAEPDQIANTLIEVVRKRIPAWIHCDPVRDIQVLSPMHRGSLGIQELNFRLQNELNPERPNEPAAVKFGYQFRVRDKVIQTSNNYDKDVFNGDIGQISRINAIDQEVTVRFDAKEVCYDYGELDELALAYAITIHKSQGSEFPVVVIPIAMQQYLLLQRNLLYTGVTRGRKLVVLIGQSKALSIAVSNHRVQQRHSGLPARLQGGVS